MTTLLWVLIFFLSLGALVKGADWFLESSERIGLALGLSPFVIGVTIVAMGTSLPELISSIFAVVKGANDIVAANAIGSNIANIYLVVGFSAVLGKKMSVAKDLIDLDLPLLAAGTVLFSFLVIDGTVSLAEAIILFVAFVVYFLYTILHRDEPHESDMDTKDIVMDERKTAIKPLTQQTERIKTRDIVLLILGAGGLVLGAQYLIDSVIALSEIFNIATGVIAVSAIALGTSLPELIVSAKAALQGKSEVAIGNIFGSNVFNMFVVVSVPRFMGPLTLNEQTLSIGLPTMITATLLFIFAGISRQLHIWEGSFFLILYGVFIMQLFGLI